jgi:hypothetical protein
MVVEMNALWLLLTPLVVGLFGSFLMELTLKPVPVVCYKRPRISLHLHVYTWLLVFALVLLVVRRPWFAVFILWAFQYLVVLVNQAKYSSLREPFLVQDFDYFTDAIKHPRLFTVFWDRTHRCCKPRFQHCGRARLTLGKCLRPNALADNAWRIIARNADRTALGKSALAGRQLFS